ncbi:Coiled-coil domain-containing protein 92 [Amphibalanus amphitrite]|uniref:Coiled-coil domain-containing protein 92 n=1 Tax=Amphibalanus amphitrite TaxID=1232801 RepID=A0A6A4WWH8_AMPAM|nr:Coiled-coil domain-containing protein 92 [Amphibalanus amphitrite]
MALTVLEAKLKSSNSALVFLQEQHQNVLRGLHAEIDSLRRQCQELQFQLATQTSQQVTEAEERHRRQLGELQRRLRQQTETADRLETERRQQQDAVAALQQQVKWTQLQLNNEGDARAQTARHLRAEISERDDAIRHLTAQLHEARATGARLRRLSRPRNASSSSLCVGTASVACQTDAPPAVAGTDSRPGTGLSRLSEEEAALVRPVGRGRRPSAAVSLPPIELNQSVGVAGGRALIRQQLRLAVDRGAAADSF